MARKQLFLVLLLLQLCLVSCHAVQLTVQRGENIALDCQHPSKGHITAWTWKKDDNRILWWRDEHNMAGNQHPSRMRLADPKMKYGNVSINIDNVTINDSGVYKCSAGAGSKVEDIRTIHLIVADSERRTGNTATAAGGSVALIVGMLVAVMIFHP